MNNTARSQIGFTLIELLIVITIITILAAMLLPVLGRAVNTARVVACMNNLKQIGIAMQFYTGDHQGHVPPIDITYGSDRDSCMNKLQNSLRDSDAHHIVPPGAPNPYCVGLGMLYFAGSTGTPGIDQWPTGTYFDDWRIYYCPSNRVLAAGDGITDPQYQDRFTAYSYRNSERSMGGVGGFGQVKVARLVRQNIVCAIDNEGRPSRHAWGSAHENPDVGNVLFYDGRVKTWREPVDCYLENWREQQYPFGDNLFKYLESEF